MTLPWSTWELFNPLYSGYLLCNEYDRPRGRWLRQTLESFIPQPLIDIIKVSELDGREMGAAQPASFDKVLLLYCERLTDSQRYGIVWLCCCLPSASRWYTLSGLREILIKWMWTYFSFDSYYGSVETVILGSGIIESYFLDLRVTQEMISYFLNQ